MSLLCWASVGALGAFGVAGPATIGIFLLAGAVLLAGTGTALLAVTGRRVAGRPSTVSHEAAGSTPRT